MKDSAADPWLLELNKALKENDGIYRSAARWLGVPECTLWVLYTLRAEEPPMTQAKLCQRMLQPKQTINSALKALAAEDCIRLSPGSDRRTREITLTAKGSELAGRTADRLIQAEIQALAGIPPEERQAFLRTYRKFNRLLRAAMGGWEDAPALRKGHKNKKEGKPK